MVKFKQVVDYTEVTFIIENIMIGLDIDFIHKDTTIVDFEFKINQYIVDFIKDKVIIVIDTVIASNFDYHHNCYLTIVDKLNFVNRMGYSVLNQYKVQHH